MLRRNAITMIAAAVVASFFGLPRAEAATPKAVCYNAWISTNSLMYQVNNEFDDGPVWEGAYYANLAAHAAFLEAYDVEKGVRGASLQVVQDHLDDALVELYYLSQMNLPGNLPQAVKSAIWYTNYARNVVNKKLQ